MRRIAIVMVAVLALVAGLARHAGGDGPWKVQIVDAESGGPVNDAVLLAIWTKRTANWPHPGSAYHDVDEAVSDADGRLVIPARDLSQNSALSAIVGPRVEVFKSGYGDWRFKDPTPLAEHPSADEMREYRRLRWERAAREGIVIAMQPVKTPQERRRALPSCNPEAGAPIQKIPRWIRACDDERVRLGLTPMYPEIRR
jgi:hypothetical protein